MATVGGPGGGRGGLGIGDLVKEGGAGSVLGWLSGPLGGVSKDKTMAVLKTVTLARVIVDKFNLKEVYRTTSDIKAALALLARSEAFVNKEGAMLITVEDTDPKRAADIANFYPEALDQVLAQFSLTNVSRQRAFVEERRAEVEIALVRAEEALRDFQEQNGVTAVLPTSVAETQEIISIPQRLKGEILAMEVDLEATRRYATEENPDVRVLQKRIDEKRKQLALLDGGGDLNRRAGRFTPGRREKEGSVPAARVPALNMDYLRLVRDLKVQETVFQILTSQLENAKIEEARNLPTIEVLDRAIPSDFAVKPRTRQNVVFAAAAGVFVGVFLAFFLEYLKTLRVRRQAAHA
jgi:tyrosine-protein kinase Etk/Wzc